MPARLEHVSKFEADNRHLQLRINVVCVEERDVYPLYSSAKSLHRQQKQDQEGAVAHEQEHVFITLALYLLKDGT